MTPIVAAAFAGFPPERRAALQEMRALAFEVAASDARIGPLTETLKWGQPAYLTQVSGSGMTLRLGISRKTGGAMLFVQCQSALVSRVQGIYGDLFVYEGTRGIVVPDDLAQARSALSHVLTLVFTYHLRA